MKGQKIKAADCEIRKQDVENFSIRPEWKLVGKNKLAVEFFPLYVVTNDDSFFIKEYSTLEEAQEAIQIIMDDKTNKLIGV